MRIGMLSWESLYSIKVGALPSCLRAIGKRWPGGADEVHIFTVRGDFGPMTRLNGVHYSGLM